MVVLIVLEPLQEEQRKVVLEDLAAAVVGHVLQQQPLEAQPRKASAAAAVS